ncbi:MAG: hypothetical protein AAGG50_05175 [Bacteroidota bacterium]
MPRFRARRLAWLPLVALALAGCDTATPSADLRLFTNADAYAANATVTLTLANEGGDEVTIHPELCGVLPQLRGEDGWDAAPPFDRIDVACTAVAASLSAGSRVEVTFPLANLDDPAGTYRFTYGTSAGPVTSNTFTVTN